MRTPASTRVGAALLAATLLAAACGDDGSVDTTTGPVDDPAATTSTADPDTSSPPTGDPEPAAEHVAFFELLADGRPDALERAAAMTATDSAASGLLAMLVSYVAPLARNTQASQTGLGDARVDGDAVHIDPLTIETVTVDGAGAIVDFTAAGLGAIGQWIVADGDTIEVLRSDTANPIQLTVHGQAILESGRRILVELGTGGRRGEEVFLEDPADVTFTSDRAVETGWEVSRSPLSALARPITADAAPQLPPIGPGQPQPFVITVRGLGGDATGTLTVTPRSLRDGSPVATLEVTVGTRPG